MNSWLVIDGLDGAARRGRALDQLSPIARMVSTAALRIRSTWGTRKQLPCGVTPSACPAPAHCFMPPEDRLIHIVLHKHGHRRLRCNASSCGRRA